MSLPDIADIEVIADSTDPAFTSNDGEAANLTKTSTAIGNGMLYHGDCLKVMPQFEAESFKAVVTSPPYNLRNSTGGFWTRPAKSRWDSSELRKQNGYEGHDDCMPRAEYVEWQRCALTEMMRLISDDGAVFYVHKWRTQNGLIEDQHDIVAGFPVRQIIIWERTGGINFNDGYYVPTYEVIYMITKPQFRLLDRENRHGTVWRFAPARNNKHPAPFPIDLPARILSTIGPGRVLDPFMGSGTTAVAAERLNREWVGIEQSEEYCQMALTRLDAECSQMRMF